MKRTIILFILSLIFTTTLAKNAWAEAIYDQISVSTSDTVVPTLGKITLTVTSNSGAVDPSMALITWNIDGNRLVKQGIGLTDITIPTEYDTIFVKVRADSLTGGISSAYYVAELELTPSLQSKSVTRSSKLIATDTSEGNKCSKDYKLVSDPPRPRMFQRVVYTLENPKNHAIYQNLVKWTVNGKMVSDEQGQVVYVVRSLSPSTKLTVRAEVEGIPEACGEITFLPRDDPSLRLRDTKATRIANCASQSLRMLQRDIDVINRRADMFKDKYESATENIKRDVAFLEDMIVKLPEELAKTGKDLFKTATTLTMARKGDPILLKMADEIRAFGQLILDNDISGRLAYIQKQIKYYENLVNSLNATQYSIQAESASMVRRIDKQKERCIQIANERPDDLIDTGGNIRDFRKYEW